MRKSLLALAAVSALAAAPAQASIDIYSAALFGANECGGAPLTCGTFGDPDGWGAATVMIDNITNSVSWQILAMAIEPAVAAHIHNAPAGTNGPVRIDFAGAFSGTVVDGDAALITPATALNFYVNVHTASYPAGAIRGQLAYVTTVNPPVPEPATYALLLAGLGAVGLMAARRQRRVF
jgi:CHRD domain/PEP-CTERM motif